MVAFAIVAPGEILSELEKLALRIGVTVRFEPFKTRSERPAAKGGLCRLRGTPLIVIDTALPLMDKIGILSEALSAFDLEAIYLPAILRTRVRAGGDFTVAGSASSSSSPLSSSSSRTPGKRGPVRPPLRGPVKAVRRGVVPA